ncbi:MAG TPA: LeuA family protein [Ilumatobacter sp.]
MPVHVIDTTLREGLQAPGVSLTAEASAEIASSLVALGVDMIECGHPAVGAEELARVRAVTSVAGPVPVLAHARARRDDIDAVSSSGASWVGLFLGVNERACTTRVRLTEPAADVITDVVGYAKGIGLGVRFTVEDASRTQVTELVAAYRAAVDAGVDRICFADTVGVLLPWEVNEAIRRLCEELGAVTIEGHFHDDRGMSAANALSAVRAGAEWISSSVNGIGERCGITDTVTLLANAHHEGWRPRPPAPVLQSVSRLVQAHTRLPVHRWRPIVGQSAFTHTARLHRKAVGVDEMAYSWTAPEALARTTTLAPASPLEHPERLVNHPEVVSAEELRHHRKGPGSRYLMLDRRVVADARQYCIVREIPVADVHGPGHVDVHRHAVDSLFLFLGHEQGLSGLRVEVRLAASLMTVDSPASVFIPSGVDHSYRVVSGGGLFVNHVLEDDYNSSLLDAQVDDHVSMDRGDAFARLHAFVASRLPDVTIDRSTPVADVFDSPMFIDYLLEVEPDVPHDVLLDRLSTLTTFGDLAVMLDR